MPPSNRVELESECIFHALCRLNASGGHLLYEFFAMFFSFTLSQSKASKKPAKTRRKKSALLHCCDSDVEKMIIISAPLLLFGIALCCQYWRLVDGKNRK